MGEDNVQTTTEGTENDVEVRSGLFEGYITESIDGSVYADTSSTTKEP